MKRPDKSLILACAIMAAVAVFLILTTTTQEVSAREQVTDTSCAEDQIGEKAACCPLLDKAKSAVATLKASIRASVTVCKAVFHAAAAVVTVMVQIAQRVAS